MTIILVTNKVAMDYRIEKEKKVYDGFLKVLEAQVKHDTFEQETYITAKRECLERGDSVAVLVYEVDTDSFVFTRQFRYPSARRGSPWMLELVAGSIDDGESDIASAKRELQEEIGYQVDKLEKIHTYFPSPGGCSEQIHLFYTEVHSSQQTQTGGGKESEKEDIQIVRIKKLEAKKILLEGAFNNSISIIGLQWWFLKDS
ncbi:ADP-ribose pyrophosphatase [Nonlabens sp. Hel1_33_55]|uniref:NUDIX domain-containing protein n=1 Tax=Nonlabens sp. Hel1_33_55 TaxID=1336802 RepID=UPI000875ACA5|nr:NUDIX hydrolase [Nonlabens sp. Hel1_33_55]SCY08651.1 ADP-ribose pyrophosphatase [Nonlabens sp. Hel1_33_55]